MAKFVTRNPKRKGSLVAARRRRIVETDIKEDAEATAQSYADSLNTYKAGTDTIADTASTEAVAFVTAFSDNNYSVAISTDGDERVWVASKTASGFTLTRSGTSGAREVYWFADVHQDP